MILLIDRALSIFPLTDFRDYLVVKPKNPVLDLKKIKKIAISKIIFLINGALSIFPLTDFQRFPFPRDHLISLLNLAKGSRA